MNTRENKYSNNVGMSRVAKNDDLYKQINNSELDNFNVRSNATVIGNQEREIDVEQIKKILDKRYNSAPKRRSIRIEERPHENIISDEPTKEYDLTKVLEKAKDEKVETYEENRAKKLRNTQYNILSNLNIDGEEKEEVKATPEENLMNLINTITINEAKKLEEKNSNSNDIDPLDILSDLKGDDDTQVYESMETEVTKITEIKEKENNNQITEVKNKNQEKLDNSFYTSNLFKKNDFEDDNKDFVDDEKIGIGIKILIVLVVVTFLVGLFLFLKSYLKF
ncbi:unknown [Clostridium sp. CAG:609]|nr:unknown [Clostridium sp. CAG:609]